MLSDLSVWWDDLNLIAKIFWIIAIPSTLLFILQLILTFAGSDTDHDFDTGHDVHTHLDDGSGFHFFTFKNMIAFFTLFAWSGLACVEGGFGLAVTLLVATLCGTVMMFIMAGLLFYISKLSYSGTLDLNNAIGKSGNVYIRIPAKKSGMGQIEIEVQGQYRTLNAMTEDPEVIKTSTLVEVTDVINENILLVKRLR